LDLACLGHTLGNVLSFVFCFRAFKFWQVFTFYFGFFLSFFFGAGLRDFFSEFFGDFIGGFLSEVLMVFLSKLTSLFPIYSKPRTFLSFFISHELIASPLFVIRSLLGLLESLFVLDFLVVFFVAEEHLFQDFDEPKPLTENLLRLIPRVIMVLLQFRVRQMEKFSEIFVFTHFFTMGIRVLGIWELAVGTPP